MHRVMWLFTQSRRIWFVSVLACVAGVQAQPPASRQIPQRYILDYPRTGQFCPPIRSAFSDAGGTRTRRANVNQRANGGFGVAMMNVGGVPLLHTGADYGWFAVGEPVFAAADGIVRISIDGMRARLLKSASKTRLPGAAMDWGSMILIEHRTPDGEYFTTLYAHLSNERRVHTGDLVMAGQMIGEIGRKSPIINGGYEPHLHFGVRKSRLAVTGASIFGVPIQGVPAVIKLDEIGRETMSVMAPPGAPDLWGVTLDTVPITIRRKNGEFRMPSWVFWECLPCEANIVGYAPSLDGWLDPTYFLRDNRADSFPATMFEPSYHMAPEWVANTTGQKAQAWDVDEWIRPLPDGIKDISAVSDKVICMVFVQSSCRTSRLAALPLISQLSNRFPSNKDVQLVVLQTPFQESRRNTVSAMEKAVKAWPASIAVGHCDADGKVAPAIVERYGISATPWTIIIDRDGVIQHSSCIVRPEEAIRIITTLRDNERAASEKEPPANHPAF